MTQILVTLEDNSITPKIMKAIEMLKGVVNISLYKEAKEEDTTTPSTKTYSPRIQRLRGIAKGFRGFNLWLTHKKKQRYGKEMVCRH